MKYVIAGTAGHIDHGKTALVRALTGIDTDRLEEEKRRGISIDLGFAHLDLPDLHIALIDVPGHEKFIKNMLAGVGGIDLVLFIIAADESVKPQTREHLDICRLLQINDGVVVLTKTDLVDSELLQLAEIEARDLVAGTFLKHAPVVPVSAVSGQGLTALRNAIALVGHRVPPKKNNRPFRLSIDRVFSMTGFGTVVTGTISDGQVEVDQEVEAHPAAGRFRVRGVQVHGKKMTRAIAGQRAALNLVGAGVTDLTRGNVLAEPARFAATKRIDCQLELLDSSGSLKNGTAVHFHSGTAELVAEVRILTSLPTLPPGSTHIVRLILREPALLLPDDRFIIRKFSPVITIGGGRVIDSHPPVQNRALSLARAQKLADAPLAERIALFAADARFGLPLRQLAQLTGESDAAISEAAPAAILRFNDWFLHRERAEAAIQSCVTRLSEFHKANPLAGGVSKEELRSKFFVDGPATVCDALLAESDQLKVTGDVVGLKAHKVVLRADEDDAVARIERAFEDGGLAVPPVAEVLQNCGVGAAKARTLLQLLLKDRRLVRVSDDLIYHPQAVDRLRNLLHGHRGQQFSVAEFKEWTGVSRKYAIPLLEFLDRERITRRNGDQRFVL